MNLLAELNGDNMTIAVRTLIVGFTCTVLGMALLAMALKLSLYAAQFLAKLAQGPALPAGQAPGSPVPQKAAAAPAAAGTPGATSKSKE